MKAIIDYHYTTEINDKQDKILFKDEWHEILSDQEGEFYFMYDGSVIYFEPIFYPPIGRPNESSKEIDGTGVIYGSQI